MDTAYTQPLILKCKVTLIGELSWGVLLGSSLLCGLKTLPEMQIFKNIAENRIGLIGLSAKYNISDTVAIYSLQLCVYARLGMVDGQLGKMQNTALWT